MHVSLLVLNIHDAHVKSILMIISSPIDTRVQMAMKAAATQHAQASASVAKGSQQQLQQLHAQQGKQASASPQLAGKVAVAPAAPPISAAKTATSTIPAAAIHPTQQVVGIPPKFAHTQQQQQQQQQAVTPFKPVYSAYAASPPKAEALNLVHVHTTGASRNMVEVSWCKYICTPGHESPACGWPSVCAIGGLNFVGEITFFVQDND